MQTLCRNRLVVMGLLSLLLACAARAGTVVVKAIGQEGVDVLVDGKVTLPIRLSSNGAILAGRVSGENGSIRLSGLRCADPLAVAFSPADYVSITPRPNLPPLVQFRLTLVKFDAQRWQKLFGDAKAPFHFLTLAMPNAQVWHHRGWLNATPNADPFPLLQDVHEGVPEISSTWNRNWSYVCPLGGHPIPMIGLWDPPAKLYAGYDFQPARATDQSDRYIATAYCWQQGRDKSFITLAYPHGGVHYGELLYPKGGEEIESRFELIADTSLADTDDPNERFQTRLFERWRDALPRVPAMNDLSWIPGSERLRDFDGPLGPAVLWGSGGETVFYPADTKTIHGWVGHREMPVVAAMRRNDQKGIDQLRHRLDELLHKYAKRMKVAGDDCLFWTKPLEGAWRPQWGGAAVMTLHNADGWYPARVMVELYRYDRGRRQSDDEYLKAIDGVFNWTRHFVWTRNEFVDVPSSPFAIGCTLAAPFLMDYHYAFKDDPARRENAQLAVKLAQNIVWRYLAIWAMDSDRFDANLDGAFLMEPNSGRDWAGLACANEAHWVIDTLTQMYVHCGDERMRYYLRGILQRWPALYRPGCVTSLAQCDRKSMTEGLGLFDGAGSGRGQRYEYGGADHLSLNEPVGESKMRVVAGQRAAIAFCKDGVHSDIVDYRTDGNGACLFRIVSSLAGEFDVSFSYPFVDVSALAAVIIRDGTARELTGDEIRRPAHAPSSLYLRKCRNGDVVQIGKLDPAAPAVMAAPILVYDDKTAGWAGEIDRSVSFPVEGDTPLSQDWNDRDSFAGIVPGQRWAWGVPYQQRLRGASKPVQMQTDGFGGLFVIYAPPADDPYGAAPVFILDNGSKAEMCSRPAVAWRAWPPLFRRSILIGYLIVPSRRTVKQIDPNGTLLMAVTGLRGIAAGAAPAAASSAIAGAGAAEQSAYLSLQSLRQTIARIPAGKLALLPPSGGGLNASFAVSSGLAGKFQKLSPQQMIDADQFNAKRFPVAFSLADEHYLKTVRAAGDGKAAVTRYLAEGGTLICLSSGPFPFFYGSEPGVEKPAPDPLLPQLGLPITIPFGRAPAGLRLRRCAGAGMLKSAAAGVDAIGGDRLRSVDRRRLGASHVYTPLLEAIDAAGKGHGDAAAYIEFRDGPAKGGKVLYLWGSLLSLYQGPTIAGEAIDWVLRKSWP